MIQIDIRAAKLIARLDIRAAEAVLAANPAISPRVAASLARRSGHVIREAVAQGSLPATGKFIRLDDLSRWCGRTAPFTTNELRAAGR